MIRLAFPLNEKALAGVFLSMSQSSGLEEGEYEEDYESDSESLSEPKGILPVGKFNKGFTPESLPTRGEEYLCQVRYQALNLVHPTVPTLTTDSVDNEIFPITTFFAPISVTQDQIDAATALFASHRKEINSTENFKKALKGDLSSLLSLDPATLKPSQVSDLRGVAKESKNEEFIIILAACFGQSDLIKLH